MIIIGGRLIVRWVKVMVLAVAVMVLPGCLVHMPAGTVVELTAPEQPGVEPVRFGLEQTVWYERDGQVTVLGRGREAREHEWHLPWLEQSEGEDAYRWLRMRSTEEPGVWEVELAIARELWPGGEAAAETAGVAATRRVHLAGRTRMPAEWPRRGRQGELEAVELELVDRPGVRMVMRGTVQAREER